MLLNGHFQEVDYNPFEFGMYSGAIRSTEAQREIFLSVKLGGDAANCAYNESVTLTLNGVLNTDIFLQSCYEVIQRHESLRGSFCNDGTLMLVSAQGMTKIQLQDVSHLEPVEKNKRVDSLKQQAVSVPFDLDNGPLVKMELLKLAEDKHAFVLTAHHIICDGWSLSLVLKEISILYSSYINNKQPDLPEPVSFAAYANYVNADSKEKKQTLSWWLDEYRNNVPQLEFPIDKQRPALRTFNAKRNDIVIPSNLIAELRARSKKEGVSFVNLMLSAFEIFLFRISGQKDVVVGLPSAGQNADGFAGLVGHCVNLLPLRTEIETGISFNKYLKTRKKRLFDAFDHQEFTFGTLLQELSVARDPSRIPLVPVVFNIDIGFTEGFKFAGLTFEFQTNPRSYENFELFVNASGYGDQLTLECTYNTDLFEEQMMQLRMDGFITLLYSICSNPELSIEKLSLLAEADRTIYNELNNTHCEFSRGKGIHELISAVSKLLPGNVAVIDKSGSLLYHEFESESNNLAAHLLKKGVERGDIVAVCLERTHKLPVVLNAVLKSGACYLPLDPGFPQERLAMMIADANVKLILSTTELANKFLFADELTFKVDVERIEETKNFESVVNNGHDLAYLLYTSGSTGKPKGVKIRHQSVVNLLEWFSARLNVNENDTLLAVTTISFDISVLEIFLPLITGSKLYICTKEEITDAGMLQQLADKYATIMQATPATWEMLLTNGWRGNSCLTLLCGGEALRTELAVSLADKCKKLFNVYGPTETTIWSTLEEIKSPTDLQDSAVVSIGRPIANTIIDVADQYGNTCPLGVAGELLIGGEGLSQGYYKRPDLDLEKFIYNSETGERFYRTGDIVKLLRNGKLQYCGRNDSQVKIRGYRIELGDIESALNSFPAIQQAIVVVQSKPEGLNALAAYYTVKGESTTVEGSQLRMFLKDKLPEYMVPSYFVSLAEFPLTPNGKIDRKLLPDPFDRSVNNANLTLLTATERKVAKIWTAILEVNAQPDDDFFLLGGHSLLAVKLMVELEKETGVRLPLAVLFSNPTIRELSKRVDERTTKDIWNPLVLIKKGKAKQPLYFAHGISGNIFKYHLISQALEEDRPCYGLQAIGLNGKDQPLQTIEEMASRHITEIKKFQPHGPYALAGGSFGGYLSYEIAQQLTAEGEHVNFLCLLDIEAGSVLDFLPNGIKQIKGIQLKAQRLYRRAVEVITADERERAAYFNAKLKTLKKKEGELNSWLDKHNMIEIIGKESVEYFKKIESASYDALMNYKIKPYAGKVILIRAKQGYFSNEYDDDLGWNHYVKEGVEVFYVNGDHNTILSEPNVKELSQTLLPCLQRACFENA